MKKYYIDYYDKSDDLCHIWCNATSKENAIDYVRSEYWDIKEIIEVRESR